MNNDPLLGLMADNIREMFASLKRTDELLKKVRENEEPETEVLPPDPEALNPATRTHEDI